MDFKISAVVVILVENSFSVEFISLDEVGSYFGSDVMDFIVVVEMSISGSKVLKSGYIENKVMNERRKI